MIIGFDITVGALFGAFVSGYGFALIIFVSADYLARRWFGKKEKSRMPDITLCTSANCPKRFACLRYIRSDEMIDLSQSVGVLCDANGKCEWFEPRQEKAASND